MIDSNKSIGLTIPSQTPPTRFHVWYEVMDNANYDHSKNSIRKGDTIRCLNVPVEKIDSNSFFVLEVNGASILSRFIKTKEGFKTRAKKGVEPVVIPRHEILACYLVDGLLREIHFN